MFRKLFLISSTFLLTMRTFAVDPVDFSERSTVIESKNYPNSKNNNFDYRIYENARLEQKSYQKAKALFENKSAPIRDQRINNARLQFKENIQSKTLYKNRYYSEIEPKTIETPFYKKILSRFWSKTKNAPIYTLYDNNFDLLTEDISLQSINRFAFRRNHSVEPSLPTQEAGKELKD